MAKETSVSADKPALSFETIDKGNPIEGLSIPALTRVAW